MIYLNGWQRLWIVTSVILLGIFMFYSYLHYWPEKNQVQYEWALELVDLVSKHNEFSQDEFELYSKYKDIPKDEFINKFTNKYIEDNRYSESVKNINEKYNKLIKSLWKKKIKIILLSLLSWLLSIIFIYVFGFSICWIYRGFKKESI